MTNKELDVLTQQVEKLSPSEQLLLIERIVALLRTRASVQDEPAADELETWEQYELQALLNDHQPMTTSEIVAAGLFGGWEDLGIEDSLAWVQAQRAKGKGRYSW